MVLKGLDSLGSWLVTKVVVLNTVEGVFIIVVEFFFVEVFLSSYSS